MNSIKKKLGDTIINNKHEKILKNISHKQQAPKSTDRDTIINSKQDPLDLKEQNKNNESTENLL